MFPIIAHENDEEGTRAAINVVAGAAGSAENCRCPVELVLRHIRKGHFFLHVRGRVPDHKDIGPGKTPTSGDPVEEDAAVVGVDDAHVPLAAVDLGRGQGAGGDEFDRTALTLDADIGDEAEQGWGAVELAESAAEAGAGDDGAPALADEGGLDKACWVVGRESEQDLLHQLLRQRRRRRRHAAGGARGGERVCCGERIHETATVLSLSQ